MKGTRLSLCGIMGAIVLACACLNAGEAPSTKANEKILEEAKLKTDGPSLLQFFKQRTLGDDELIQVEALIQEMGSNSFAKREKASAKLSMRGPVIVPILKKYFDHSDLELSSRAKKCVQHIQEKDYSINVLRAAVGLLRDRKPEGTVPVLLQYLPFADNEEISEEVRTSLAALAMKEGKAHPALVKGLTTKDAVIRSAAGEALALAKDKQHSDTLWKMLNDSETLVKYRVALGLATAGEGKAMPALIKMIPELSMTQAWQLESALFRLAEGKKPPQVSLGQSKKSRQEFSEKWTKWWNDHGGMVNLAQLKDNPKLLGYTLMVLLDAGQVMEIGQNNEVRWQLNNLNYPLDVQILPDDRVLIAEYHGGKVTERDFKGEIKWQYPIFGPQAAQRLPNGNTFIVTDDELVEINKDKNKVFSHFFPKGERIMKATKLTDGRIVCLTDFTRVVVIDEKGKELKSFQVLMLKKLFGGKLDVTPTGRVLIPFNQENKVVEYDFEGNEIWKKEQISEPIAAIRLPNGNTLITTMERPGKVFEFDRAGNEVWNYHSKIDSRITRAYRR